MEDSASDAIFETLSREDRLANAACFVCNELDETGPKGPLLLCDYRSASMPYVCNRPTHVFCAGLDAVPDGKWIGPCCEGHVLSNKDKEVKSLMEKNELKYSKGMTMEDALQALQTKAARQAVARYQVDQEKRDAESRR